jgi:uncharacterized membrane protein (UPF0127 family)
MPSKIAKSKDPEQQKIRDAKKNWNIASRAMIAKIIAFKKGINGRGDAKSGLPVSDIKMPIPAEVSSFANEIEANFQQLMQAAEQIEAMQATYAARKQKTLQERQMSKVKSMPNVAPKLEKPAVSTQIFIKRASIKNMTTGELIIKDYRLNNVLLAQTPQEQENGLMYCSSPAPVMAFTYRYPQVNKFWMKNTLLPLDIVFSLRGKITGIFKGEPYSTASIGNDIPSDLIVEMQHGTCKELGINVGDPVFLIQ